MKKLYVLILIGLTSQLYADTVTSGNVGLIQVTTGTIDKSRSWLDKLNSNSGVIASTMGTMITDIQNLKTNNFNSVYSTNIVDGQIAGVDFVTGTILSTHIAAAGIGGANMANIILSTHIVDGTIRGTDFSAATIISTHIASINGQLVPLSNIMALQDEGSFVANIGTINCVGGNIACTASGQTGAFTITGGGGGATESTITIKLVTNGDVLGISSANFEAITGAVYSVHFASLTILGWESAATTVSSVTATKYRLAYSTVTDGGTAFTYISTESTHDINLKWNTYYSSSAKTLNYHDSIAVHITSSAVSGAPMSGFKVLIRARKGLDNQP